MQRSDCRLGFLHGFLGAPQDWEEVIRYLPEFKCQALSYPFNIEKGAVAVGYSMGGRIALSTHFGPKILVSTHPGLKTSQEKQLRLESDERWAVRFESEPLAVVLKDWYDQPLFQSLKKVPRFETILSFRSKQNGAAVAQVLRKESLALQTFSKDGFFIHGELDTKLVALYRQEAISSIEIAGVGHAAHLENPQALAEQIKCLLESRVFC
jgi:2-succinyl-6-hydroxy-2,4-cyclohexadiene-1-carboxylate synthase